MWPLRKKPRQRRFEGRKAPPGGWSAWQKFTRSGGLLAAALAVVFYLAAAGMYLWPVEPFGYRLGQYLPEDVHARVDFRVRVPERVKEAAQQAELRTPAVFRYDPAAVAEITTALRRMPRRAPAPPATQPAPTTAPAPTTRPAEPTTAPADANMLSPWQLVAEDPNALKAYLENVDRLAAALRGVYTVRLKPAEEHKHPFRWPRTALLHAPGQAQPAELTAGELTDVDNPDEAGLSAATAARLASVFLEPRREVVREYLTKALPANPVYRYDRRATQERMDAAVSAVFADPPDEVYKEYSTGERIVSRSLRKTPDGERAIGLTHEEMPLLAAEHEAFARRQAEKPLLYWSRLVGKACIAMLVVMMLAAYVARYHGDLIADRGALTGILVLLAAMLATNKVLAGVLHFNPLVALLPVMMTGAVLTIARNQRFALAVGVFMALLVLLQIRGSMEQLLVMLVGMAAILFQLRDVRSRTTLIRASAVAATLTFLAVLVTGLATAKPWPFLLRDGMWAAGSGLMCGFVIQGALPLIESAFHVATSLTLLEWCDASRPLLKRLAMEAPGTYNHSLQLGALCEAGAEAIGARGLLARVGAYYHDIGKINKPDYFIENQAGLTSRHAKLSPAMSLLIIIGHVKDGLELAREYGLPKVLHEFITSHHGTTLVQYFYHAAAEQRKEAAERAPDEAEFRYPGPKPRSKEPAILMLADAAESSVRAMSDPTAGRIEDQVHAMVNRRLMDGQLDECDLTLKEVHQIEASLVKGLCSMYHTRIAYPTPPNSKAAPGDAKPAEDKPEGAENGNGKNGANGNSGAKQ